MIMGVNRDTSRVYVGTLEELSNDDMFMSRLMEMEAQRADLEDKTQEELLAIIFENSAIVEKANATTTSALQRLNFLNRH